MNEIMAFFKEKPIFARVLISAIGGGLIGFVLDGVRFNSGNGRRLGGGSSSSISFDAGIMGDFMILFIIIGVFVGLLWGLRHKKIL